MMKFPIQNLNKMLNINIWEKMLKLIKRTNRDKFVFFVLSIIIIGFCFDIFLEISNMIFFTYTMILAIVIYSNEKVFLGINDIRLWELLIGIIIVLSSFILVTPIKHMFFPKTRVFGVFNAGIFITGYFICFYGIRNYRKTYPYHVFYISLVTINGLWGIILNDFGQKYISPISASITYSLLKSFGYPVDINGTTITIYTLSSKSISATIAGSCSGAQGMTLSAIMLIGLMIGTNLSYKSRFFYIVLGVGIMFFLNIIRLCIIYISAYHYDTEGLNMAHEWVGNIIFMVFILSYWVVIERQISKNKLKTAE